MANIHIVFDGPPGPEAGRFVEVENDAGANIKVGEWRDRGDGMWELVIQGGEIDLRDWFAGQALVGLMHPKWGTEITDWRAEEAYRLADAMMDLSWQRPEPARLPSDRVLIDQMDTALTKCRDRFREYAEHHRAKGTTDGDEKAKRNEEMVDMIEAIIEMPF